MIQALPLMESGAAGGLSDERLALASGSDRFAGVDGRETVLFKRAFERQGTRRSIAS